MKKILMLSLALLTVAGMQAMKPKLVPLYHKERRTNYRIDKNNLKNAMNSENRDFHLREQLKAIEKELGEVREITAKNKELKILKLKALKDKKTADKIKDLIPGSIEYNKAHMFN